jgi:hypothetical protein
VKDIIIKKQIKDDHAVIIFFHIGHTAYCSRKRKGFSRTAPDYRLRPPKALLTK